jgi:hypothetical protein
MAVVHYCDECGMQVTEADIERGAAYARDGKVLCPRHRHLASAEPQKPAKGKPGKKSASRLPKTPAETRSTPDQARARRASTDSNEPKKISATAWIIIANALIFIIVCIVLYFSYFRASPPAPSVKQASSITPDADKPRESKPDLRSGTPATPAPEKDPSSGNSMLKTLNRSEIPVPKTPAAPIPAVVENPNPGAAAAVSTVLILPFNRWSLDNPGDSQLTAARRGESDPKLYMKLAGVKDNDMLEFRLRDDSEGDWIKLGAASLAFDIWSNKNTMFTLRIHDRKHWKYGDCFDKLINLREGRNSFSVPMEELSKKNMLPDKITRVIFLLEHQSRDLVLYFDEIKLVK